jgi:DNA-binding protein
MNVKVNQSSSQKTNPQTPQPNINLSDQQILEQILQLLQQKTNPQTPQQMKNDNNSNNEFVVKANMKSSYIAVRIEQILLAKKKIVLSGLGFAIPVLIDAALLVRKDMGKVGKQVNIEGIELVEKEVLTSNTKKKIVSGIKVTLSI